MQVYKTEKTDIAAHPAAADFRTQGRCDPLRRASSSAWSFEVDQREFLTPAYGAKHPLAGSIGPQTSATMKKCGIKVDFEAEKPGIDELVDALVKKLNRP